MNDKRGSLWRKWDLHVHTPESIINHYSGDEKWDKFIKDIESLPPEFKVIGINDYIFLDGYKRILEEKDKGRFKNIELFLPVIELRIDKFGGSKGHLSRVNYHVIFSNELEPETIEQQFLYALSKGYSLSAENKHHTWNGLTTRKSLEDLGKEIINSIPEKERSKFNTPLIEGFNNLCCSLECIQKALESSYFIKKYITAIGKTEWADVKWDDQMIAEKKHIINVVDLVFTSAATPENANNSLKSLSDQKVNSKLLDCSDAHHFKDSKEKDRIGKCFTWIKADTTFEGLLQVLNEPKERIFIGDTPLIHTRVKKHPTKYIKSISIKKKQDQFVTKYGSITKYNLIMI